MTAAAWNSPMIYLFLFTDHKYLIHENQARQFQRAADRDNLQQGEKPPQRLLCDFSAPAFRKAFPKKQLCLGYFRNTAVLQPTFLNLPGKAQESLWIARPLRSLGSNQVVFGGIMFPESAMSISCCIETG